MPSSSHQNACLEALGQQQRLGFELRRLLDQSQAPGAARRQPLAGKDIALNLRQRDIAFGELSVGMEDRVEGILPALVGKPLLGGALILDEAVLVGIAGAVDPLQRRLDRRPQLGQRFVVAGAFDIKAGQQNEQRGRIDAAVILRERHLAQRGHLAAAHLVQDLAGLGIGERIVVLAWKKASRRSTPWAMRGSTHSICSAVINPSRPNVVEYQGMPA